MANKPIVDTSKNPFGAPIFSELPDGPRYYDDKNGKPSVSVFTVRVPLLNSPVTLIATAYGRPDKNDELTIESVSFPGRGGRGGKAILSVPDNVAAAFGPHVLASAEKWAGLSTAMLKADNRLQAGPDKPTGKTVLRFKRPVADGAELTPEPTPEPANEA